MGASPSSEIFHEIIHDMIKPIPNCANISDNIWLWSKDKKEHLKQLDHLLTVLENSGLTLKFPKCLFAAPHINVFGHIVSAKGIQIDESKVEAVKSASRPTCVSEIKSFLGLTNYCSRYVPNYSTITYPLRKLLKSGVKFEWKEEQELSFQKLKQALSSSPVLAHYSLQAETRVVVDASPWALGAILLQKQPDQTYRPVAYGSRSLTDTEKNYGQIEKEALAIVFGIEHFHMYVYGRNFELETDHRPLEHIFQPKKYNPSKPPPARLERWRLRLQEYDFSVVYKPGPTNLADPLSRLNVQTGEKGNMESSADRYVHFLAHQMTPRAMNIEEIKQFSKDDPELIQVRECLVTNKLHMLAQSYKSVADQLCIWFFH